MTKKTKTTFDRWMGDPEIRKSYKEAKTNMNKKRIAVIKGRQMGWTNWLKCQINKYNGMTSQEIFNEEFMTQWPKRAKKQKKQN